MFCKPTKYKIKGHLVSTVKLVNMYPVDLLIMQNLSPNVVCMAGLLNYLRSSQIVPLELECAKLW